MVEKLICIIINTSVMTAAQLILFLRLSEFRFERKKVHIVATIFATICCILCIGLSIANNVDRSTGLTLLTLTVPSLIFFFIISKYRGVRFFTTYCIADISIALAQLFVYMFGLLVYPNNFTIDWIVRASTTVLWTAALYFLIGDRYRKALNLLPKGWWLMLLCAVIMYVLMSLLSAYPTPIADRIEDVPLAMLMVAVMELTVIIIIRLLYSTLIAKEQQLREENLKNRCLMAEQQYALISENIEQVRKLRHDMKHHMNIVHGLLDSQRYDELQNYLDDYQSDLSALDTELPLYTRNQTVNILAGYYVQRANAEGIQTDFSIRLPEELPIDQTQLTVLLGNLWQNALEACQELPQDSDRWIKTSISLYQGKFMLQCANSAAHVLQSEDGTFLSTKGSGHGNGLAGIEDITSLYNGFCEFDFDGQVFSTSVVLPFSSSREVEHDSETCHL